MHYLPNFSTRRQTNTAHIHHSLLAFAITMEIDEESNIGRDDCDENDLDFLLIIAQCIINNNIALIQLFSLGRHNR